MAGQMGLRWFSSCVWHLGGDVEVWAQLRLCTGAPTHGVSSTAVSEGARLTWRLSNQPKRTRGRLQELFCLHLRSHAALPLQHSIGYRWVLRPSQIQEERNRIHFLIRGHFVEQLEKYCCSHLEKIQSATLAPVSHLFTTQTASTRFLSRS